MRRGAIGAATVLVLLVDASAQVPQQVRWLRVGSLRSWFSSYGCEMEIGRTGNATEQNDGLMWPAEFPWQNNEAGKAMWLGTTNYFDRTLNTVVPYKVVAVGPRTADPAGEVMPASFVMYGRYKAPIVTVDGLTATDNALNDEVDEARDTLRADRMIVNELNTYIGITIRRRILAFTHQDHDNYFIYEYVLKNTGIVDSRGTIETKTLTGVVLHFSYRYAFGNESFKRGWYPSNHIDWGRNAVNQVIGTNPAAPGFDLRAQYSWYGRDSQSPIPDDLGLPYSQGDGHLAAVHIVGTVTLHADRSATDHSDDPSQPMTTMYLGNDTGPQTNNQFDPTQMGRKYQAMTAGHPSPTHADAVGSGYADQWGSDAGGYAQGKGFGPYTLAPGDSVRIVIAEAVAGLSRQQAFAIGATWLRNQPPFTLPGGATTTDRDVYKDAWVMTGVDSLLQTFRRARANFNGGYQLPLSPPAPGTFQVTSGGDRIRLTWSGVAWPNLVGYDIYRATGQPDTFYTKVASVDKSVTSYDDTTPQRSINYYYYIVSRDDGTTNAGVPLTSSKFLTMTNTPAFLRRPAQVATLDSIRVVPNPYHRAAALANMYFGSTAPDRIAFYGLPPVCTIKIYTERGDLVNTLEHNDGSGDQLWDQTTSSRQIIVSGLYIAVFETPEGAVAVRKFIVIR
ncbi:MAG: fibronectin type III domain-containing protein [Bacteroidota bacterium]